MKIFKIIYKTFKNLVTDEWEQYNICFYAKKINKKIIFDRIQLYVGGTFDMDELRICNKYYKENKNV